MFLYCSVEGGFRDDLSTYGLVSGLWASTFALGAFVGPSIGGILFDVIGFRMGTLVVMSTQFMSVSSNQMDFQSAQNEFSLKNCSFCDSLITLMKSKLQNDLRDKKGNHYQMQCFTRTCNYDFARKIL